MFSKKGVSPLIATVLLLAFAVALATVIIQLKPFESCNVEIKHFPNGEPRVCFNEENNEIEVNIQNNEKYTINGFKIIVSASKNPLNIENYATKIFQNEEAKLRIEYDPEIYGQIIDMTLYPILNSTSKKDCTLKDKNIPVTLCPKTQP